MSTSQSVGLQKVPQTSSASTKRDPAHISPFCLHSESYNYFKYLLTWVLKFCVHLGWSRPQPYPARTLRTECEIVSSPAVPTSKASHDLQGLVPRLYRVIRGGALASFPGFTLAIGLSTRVKPGNEATGALEPRIEAAFDSAAHMAHMCLIG